MEDTLWERLQTNNINNLNCLNPYSNGRYSMSAAINAAIGW